MACIRSTAVQTGCLRALYPIARVAVVATLSLGDVELGEDRSRLEGDVTLTAPAQAHVPLGLRNPDEKSLPKERPRAGRFPARC